MQLCEQRWSRGTTRMSLTLFETWTQMESAIERVHVPSRHFVRQSEEHQPQDGNPKRSSQERRDQMVTQMVRKDTVLRDLLRTRRIMRSSHTQHPTGPQALHFAEVNPQEAYPCQTDTWGLHFVSSITPDENVWIDI